MFHRMLGVDKKDGNRDLVIKRYKGLKESMLRYDFLWYYPIICYRVGKKLYVKDGQHRLLLAEMLGLQIFYVVTKLDFDVAIVSSAACPWVLKDYDYIGKFIREGNPDYAEGLQ